MSVIDDTPLSLGAQDRARLHEALDTALNTPDARGFYFSFTTFGVQYTESVGLVLGRVGSTEIMEASVQSCKRVLERMAAYQTNLATETRQ